MTTPLIGHNKTDGNYITLAANSSGSLQTTDNMEPIQTELFTNATVAAGTYSSTIEMNGRTKLLVFGKTSSATAEIGLAFSNNDGSVFFTDNVIADKYDDGAGTYHFALQRNDILTEEVQILVRTAANNLTMGVVLK